jgi:predicted nucleic acid-binding protein
VEAQQVIYVLDACAIFASLNGETGEDKIDALFQQAHEGTITLAMSIINLLEVYYGYFREKGRETAIDILAPIYDTPLAVINTISPRVYQEAARLKGTYCRLSLADAVGVATAIELSGRFVSSDHHELDIIARQERVDFFWFR